jgi:hypothetical protein
MATPLQIIVQQVTDQIARQARAQASAAGAAAAAPHLAANNPHLAAQASAAAIAASPTGTAKIGALNTGVLALTSIQQAFEKITGVIQEVVSSVKSFNAAMLESVAAYKPFQVEMFTRRLKDLQAVFGLIFLPVMLEVMGAVRALSDYLVSLASPFRNILQAFGRIAIVFAVIIAIATPIAAVIAAVTTLTIAFVTIIGVVIAFSEVLIPAAAIAFAILLPLALIAAALAALGAALTAIVYAFSQTTGGAGFFRNALKTVGDAFETILQVIDGVWQGLKPIRDLIGGAFSELGDALSKLIDAMKPAILIIVIAAVSALTAVLLAFAAVATIVAKVIQVVVYVFRQIFGLFNAILGFSSKQSPLAQQNKQSSFGLAAQGGSISSDVASVKTRIEEIILAQTGREGPTDKDVPELTKDISENVRKIANFLDKLPTFSGIARTAASAASPVTGVVSAIAPGPELIAQFLYNHLFGD